MHAAQNLGWLVQPFAAITLDGLNAKAAMLERLDQKYVLRAAVLEHALPALADIFEVLEIDQQRAFTYDTCYFDDAERACYHDHHQGRRRRMKVRVRRYVDAGLCFVEVKLKDKRGITVKKRMPYSVDRYGLLDEQAQAHVQACWEQQYGDSWQRKLEPALQMSYRRVTLVAREGGERMTIDSGIHFFHESGDQRTAEDVFIVETKSANGNGLADAILRRLHQHPTSGCSKYCVGMGAVGAVQRTNKFKPALRKLGATPVAL
jgi:hypothetical protein